MVRDGCENRCQSRQACPGFCSKDTIVQPKCFLWVKGGQDNAYSIVSAYRSEGRRPLLYAQTVGPGQQRTPPENAYVFKRAPALAAGVSGQRPAPSPAAGGSALIEQVAVRTPCPQAPYI